MEFTFDAYEVLGISKTSNISEIRAAFRSLTLACHPDKLQSKSFNSIQENEISISTNDESIGLLIAARNILCDPIQRKEHDAYLDNCQTLNYSYNKVLLSEFLETESQLFSYPCRCGDVYKVRKLCYNSIKLALQYHISF